MWIILLWTWVCKYLSPCFQFFGHLPFLIGRGDWGEDMCLEIPFSKTLVFCRNLVIVLCTWCSLRFEESHQLFVYSSPQDPRRRRKAVTVREWGKRAPNKLSLSVELSQGVVEWPAWVGAVIGISHGLLYLAFATFHHRACCAIT